MTSIFIKMTFILLSIIANFESEGDFYQFKVIDVNGKSISLEKLRGKSTLIVVLPNSNNGNTNNFLYSIDSLSKAYREELSIIGFPAFDFGDGEKSLVFFQKYFDNNSNKDVIISSGVYVCKRSADQDSLFNWLTHYQLNGHFDNDVVAPGQKFFINANGELRAVLSPQVPLTDKILRRLMSAQ